VRLPISVWKLMAALLLLLPIGGSAYRENSASSGTAAITFGVLASSCSPDRVAAERRAGIQIVTLDLVWDLYEPQEGQFAADYVADLQRKVSICREAGLQVILSVGLQYPPSWVHDLASSTYVDQYGNLPSLREANLVFSQAVREAVGTYLRRMSTDLGFDNFAAVRVGTSSTGELGYPGDVDDADQGMRNFWAFDAAAQSGDGLASGMSPTPLPGWVPGMTVWRDQPISAQQTTEWFQWYSRSLVATISWQVNLLRALGFAGDFHLPLAGRGALPQDLRSALSNHLDGRGDPDGALERGLNYPDQFPLLADLSTRLETENSSARIVVDFTGLDDNTAVRARKANPPQEICQPGDTEGLLTRTDVDRWAAQRWTIANAELAHLSTVGENPGPPNAPTTGGSPDSDNAAQQMAKIIPYAKACRLSGILWAFENDLFDEDQGVGIDDYAREISGWSRPYG
jgi:hypothetical protein